MGVVYKLKDSVVAYIVDQKKQNPSLSCRQFVSLIKEKFKTTISKSSINNVIQNADLSGPVGRHPQEDGPGQRHAPPAPKKKQLLSQSLKSSLGLKELPAEIVKPKPVVKKQVKRVVKKTPLTPPSPASGPTREEAQKTEAVPVKESRSVDKGKYYDGMGSFFLKAAEWTLSDKPVFGHTLHKYISNIDLADVEATCEILLYLEPFGMQEPMDLVEYQGQGLWALNGFDRILDYQVLLKIVEGLKDIKGFNLEMSNQVSQMMQPVYYFNLRFNDSTEILMDAQMTSLWSNNVQSELSFPLEKTLDLMSKLIVNNLSPIVLCAIPGDKSFASQFYDFVRAAENLKNKEIAKISLLDSEKIEIAEFTTIPNQRRFFIAGAWPWQTEFQRFVDESAGLKAHSFSNEIVERRLFYTESYSNFLNDKISEALAPVRVYLIRESREDAPVAAIVTNYSAVDMPAEKVILAYLQRWPNLHRGRNIACVRDSERSKEHLLSPSLGGCGDDDLTALLSKINLTASLRSNFRGFMSILNNHCKKWFFPLHFSEKDINELVSICYGLPGYLKKMDDCLIVHLLAPHGDHAHREDLEYAAKRVNESDVKDSQGRRLVIFVEEAV